VFNLADRMQLSHILVASQVRCNALPGNQMDMKCLIRDSGWRNGVTGASARAENCRSTHKWPPQCNSRLKHAAHLLNISLKDEISVKNLPFGIGCVICEILYLDQSETRLSSSDLAASVAEPFQINDATDMKEASSFERVSMFQQDESDVFVA
jgi:hypothetical protein